MSLKKKLKNNQLTIGSWIMMNDPMSVEIMALAGFEWLVVDIEHTSIDLESTKNLIRTIQANDMKALVRVSKNEEVIIKKWALANCSGPWTGLSEDGKELTVIPGHEEARNKIAGEASLLLTLFGAYIGGKKPFENLWTGATIGFEDFWPEDSVG